MSAAKNVIEGIGGMVDHINATPFKLGVTEAALMGEFGDDELRVLFDKLDRCRWRLLVLQNCVRNAVYKKADTTGDLFGHPVPAAEPDSLAKSIRD